MADAHRTEHHQHASHWGTFTAAVGDDGGLEVRPSPADPEPARLLRNFSGALDERVRVTTPHVRRGWLDGGPGADPARGRDEYVPVSWEHVLALAAGELDRVRGEHGNGAIYGGSYGWGSAGRFHHAQSQAHRFLAAIGGYVRSVNTYSFGAATPLLRHVVGDDRPMYGATTWPVIAAHTEHFVCFGGMPAKNLQVNSGGIAAHTTAGYIRQARDRGARFTLVSPQRDDLAAELDATWLPLVPGTDTALQLALCHTLVQQGLHDKDFLATYCVGFPEFEHYLSGVDDGIVKDAAWASQITGLAEADIVELAESMAQRRTLITLSWSLQRSRYGEQPLWAGIALACLLGQLGLPGGGVGHGYGATAGMGNLQSRFPLPKLPQGGNAVREFIPVARISDMLLRPGESYDYDGMRLTYPDIKLVYWAGGNPFHHHQDLARLREAFTRPDTVITHEQFWTATARHADIVLPATTSLEREDIGCSRLDRTIIAMRRVAEPLGEARSDYAIFSDLAARLGHGTAFTEGRDERAWLEHLYEAWRAALPDGSAPEPDFAAFWHAGEVELPHENPEDVLYADFRADPVTHALPTPSGRIELFSETIDSFGYDDCPGHPAWLEPEELREPLGDGEFPLLLVANNPATRLHSQLDHGAESADSKVAGREPLRMHAGDAEARGLTAGTPVLVRSAVGSAVAGLVVSDEVRPGVVRLSTGAWFDPSAPEVATCVHGNPNALTRDIGTSRLAQGCAGQLARVEVGPLPQDPPPVRAYTPPVAN